MPPTKHMTGDVFRGYLLDGFFNLVGAMTGQGILLVGMMTEAVVTPVPLRPRPRPAERPLRPERRRAGSPRTSTRRATASSRPGPGRCSREAVDLLDRIVHDSDAARRTAPLLAAIADGTFGLMKRPPTGGKGLDGVVASARTATTTRRSPLLEAGTARPPTDPAARRTEQCRRRAPRHRSRPYGDTTGDGMVQMSFTLPLPHDKRAEGAALQLAAKMGLDPALLVHAKAMGPHFTFFVVYGSVDTTSSTSREVDVVEREFPLLSAKEVNVAIKKRLRRKLVVVGACIGTDAHTVGIDAILNIKGFAGEKGLEYYREITVVNLGAQVLVPDLVARARAEQADAVLVSQVVTQRDAHIHNTTADVRRVPRGLPRRHRCRCSSSAARVSRRARRRGSASTGSSGGARPRARSRSYLVHALPPAAASRRQLMTRPTREAASDDPRRAADRHPPPLRARTATPTTPATSSTARTPWRPSVTSRPRCASAPTATRGCSRPTATCSSSRPVRAGDVIEIEARLVRVGRRSREMEFEVRVVAPGHARAGGDVGGRVLDPPVVATTARGVVVVPCRLRDATAGG